MSDITIQKDNDDLRIGIHWPAEKVFEYMVPIYNRRVYFVTDPETFAAVYGFLTERLDDVDECLGMVRTLAKPDTGETCYIVGVFDNDMATFIHELGHLVIEIFSGIGMRVSPETSEGFCYLLDTLYTAFVGQMKPTPAEVAQEAPESAIEGKGGK